MRIFATIILIIAFFLMGTNFFIHFMSPTFSFYFILSLVIFVIFSEILIYNSGFWPAVTAGLMWDIFSSAFIGFHILIFIIGYFIISYFLQKYVRISTRERA